MSAGSCPSWQMRQKTEQYTYGIDRHQERDQGSRKVNQAVLEMDQRYLCGRGLALRHVGGQMSWAQLIGSSQSRVHIMISRKEWTVQSDFVFPGSSCKMNTAQAGRSGYGCGTRPRDCDCDCHVPRLMGIHPCTSRELGPQIILLLVVQGFCLGSVGILSKVLFICN
jgi:hypothetical protein